MRRQPGSAEGRRLLLIPHCAMGQDGSRPKPGRNAKGATAAQPAAGPQAEAYKYTSFSVPRQGVVDEQIVIVNEAKPSKRALDGEVEALRQIPRFFPILKTTVSSAAKFQQEENDHLMGSVDTNQLLYLCARFKFHLKGSAQTVSVSQAELADAMQGLDRRVGDVVLDGQRAAARLRKCGEQLKTVSQLEILVKKAEASIQQITPLMKQINNMLPDKYRLEPFGAHRAAAEAPAVPTEPQPVAPVDGAATAAEGLDQTMPPPAQPAPASAETRRDPSTTHTAGRDAAGATQGGQGSTAEATAPTDADQ